MKHLICLLLLVLNSCVYSGEPDSESQALADTSVSVPETYTPTNGDETAYTGAVTLYPGSSVAFGVPVNVQSVMPWYSGNANVKDGDVYFNVGDNHHAFLEFNLPREPLWLPVPPSCVRVFMRNDSAETITVGLLYDSEER